MFPLQNGAHTIIQDIQKYRQVFSTSTLNPFPNHLFAKGTAVDYKEATTYAKDPLVRSLALASLSLSVERVDRCVACTGGIHLAVPIRHLGGDFHPK